LLDANRPTGISFADVGGGHDLRERGFFSPSMRMPRTSECAPLCFFHNRHNNLTSLKIFILNAYTWNMRRTGLCQ